MKRNTKRKKNSAKEEELDLLKKMVKMVESEEESDDDETLFGNYIASELRHINDERTKLIVKNTITNTILQARIGLLGNPNVGSYQQVPPAIQMHGSITADGLLSL